MSEDSLIPEEGGEAGDMGADAPGWSWTESVPGEGEKPEWLLDKYQSVDKQAEAYVALQSKLGSFTGAPEGEDGLYGYSMDNFVPEGIEGYEVDAEDPFLTGLVPVLKELNLSQDGLDKLVQRYVGLQSDLATEAEAARTAEMEKLGANAAKRLGNVSDFMKAHLDTDRYQALTAGLTSAAAIEAAEILMSKIKGSAMASDAGAPSVTAAEVEAMWHKTNEQGQRLVDVDPEYRKMVRAKRLQVVGDQPYMEIVGN